MNTLPPQSITELQQRALNIAGLSLGDIAEQHAQVVPENLLRKKGWIGQLLEVALGTTAGNTSQPDFPHLGVELKTVPVNSNGIPQETTYVCTVPLLEIGQMSWEQSSVKKKLSHVLWVPIEADTQIAIKDRKVGMPLFWTMDQKTEAIIRKDWEEFAEKICLGEVESINARQGTYLQIRPKAANSRARCKGINAQGLRFDTLPRGFYLRTCVTRDIFAQYLSGVA